MEIESLLLRYQSLGINLYIKDEDLAYSAPQNVINSKIKEELNQNKDLIINYLKETDSSIIIDKSNKYTPFPLTDIQLAYMVGRNESYRLGGFGCIVYAEYLTEKIDHKVFQKAWDIVLNYNEMLNAKILTNGMQKISEQPKDYIIKTYNIEKKSDQELEYHLSRIRKEYLEKEYNIYNGELYDIAVTTSDNYSIIHFSIDMIVCDFISIEIIFRELLNNYISLKNKDKQNTQISVIKQVENTLSKKISFRDIVIYKQNLKKTVTNRKKYIEDKKYWLERLKKFPLEPKLPFVINTTEASIIQYNLLISEKRLKEINDIIAPNHLTLSCFILTAYAIALQNLSNNKNFSLNITMTDRFNYGEKLVNTIGDFTTTNILEIKESKNLNFMKRALKIQDQLLDDIDHSSFSGVEFLRELSKYYNKEIIIPYVFTSTLGLSANDNSDIDKKYKLRYKMTKTPQVIIDCQVIESGKDILISWDVRKNAIFGEIVKVAFKQFEYLLLYSDLNYINELDFIKKEILNNKEFGLKEGCGESWIEASNDVARTKLFELFKRKDIFLDDEIYYSEDYIIDKLKANKKYISLILKWLTWLKNNGYIEYENSVGYRKIPTIYNLSSSMAWEKWEKIDAKVNYSKPMMGYFKTCLNSLEELLQNKTSPLSLLFPQGSFDIALAAYKNNIVNQFINLKLVELVKNRIEIIKSKSKNTIKILEIGAGVGGTSIDLLKAIYNENISYHFTDISRAFLNNAKSLFEEYDDSKIKYHLFDINKDFVEQGLREEEFDVIIANNVIHNAVNIPEVLKDLMALLNKNGILLFIEQTKETLLLLTSVEFLMSSNYVDSRKHTNTIFLDIDEWTKIISDTGGNVLGKLPLDDDPISEFGQTLFCVQKSKKNNKQDMYKENNKVNDELLEIWKETLGLDYVNVDDNFYELGGDSLIATQIVSKVKEKIKESENISWQNLMISFIETPTLIGLNNALKLKDKTFKIKQESKVISNLVVINESDDSETAKVIIHDGTGTISKFSNMMPKLIKSKQNILALVCNDKDTYVSIEPRDLIEKIGYIYAKELMGTKYKSFELIGYCIGGLIALEVAKNLTKNNLNVSLVTSIDTLPMRNMIDNEILIEKLFANTIGLFDNNLNYEMDIKQLRNAIIYLNNSYSGEVSNENILLLPDNFKDIKIRYNNLMKKSHNYRLDSLFNSLNKHKNKIKVNNYFEKEKLYKIFSNSYKAVRLYGSSLYFGNVRALICDVEDYGILPIDKKDVELFLKDMVMGDFEKTFIKGNHMDCLDEKYSEDIYNLIFSD